MKRQKESKPKIWDSPLVKYSIIFCWFFAKLIWAIVSEISQRMRPRKSWTTRYRKWQW